MRSAAVLACYWRVSLLLPRSSCAISAAWILPREAECCKSRAPSQALNVSRDGAGDLQQPADKGGAETSGA